MFAKLMNLLTNNLTKINQNSDQQINFNTSVVGYLDDTSWYAPSLEKLKLANEFYELANITINHDKYEILTNDKKRCNKEITLQVTHQKSIKVTTVYINAFHTHGLTLRKLRQIVKHYTYIM
ncbi:unnamed protein product [Rhizophagus irregularis]|nr:unnamed protein product [Rhizophagus irregularis]